MGRGWKQQKHRSYQEMEYFQLVGHFQAAHLPEFALAQAEVQPNARLAGGGILRSLSGYYVAQRLLLEVM